MWFLDNSIISPFSFHVNSFCPCFSAESASCFYNRVILNHRYFLGIKTNGNRRRTAAESMRRRALIMAVLLVAPLPLVGGSRRPVFLLRPSPGLRKRVRFPSPKPPSRGRPIPAGAPGRGLFLMAFALPVRVASVCPFVGSRSSFRPVADRWRSRAAVVVSRSCTVVFSAYVTSPGALLRQSGRTVATSRPGFRPVAYGALPSFGCARRCQLTATARVSKQGKTLDRSSPGADRMCKPHHGRRAM